MEQTCWACEVVSLFIRFHTLLPRAQQKINFKTDHNRSRRYATTVCYSVTCEVIRNWMFPKIYCFDANSHYFEHFHDWMFCTSAEHSLTEQTSGSKTWISTPSKGVIWYCRMFGGSLLHSFYVLTLRWLMSYIYGAPTLDVSRSHTTTQHSR